MSVQTYMVRHPVTANLNDGAHQTWMRMRERGIRHMPVLDDQGALVGIVSDRDLLRPAFVDAGPNTVGSYVLDNSVKVHQAMTPAPTTLSPGDAVGHALDEFLEHKFGALPVTDDDGRLVGILSTIDLLRAFRDRVS